MVEIKQKIILHLWFDKEAKEAAGFYTSLFPESKITSMTTLHNTPSGDSDIVSFELAGYQFMAISAGPLFKFNPSVSFLVACQTKEELDAMWNELSKGGKPLMDLGTYPFSEKYGWIIDKYGLSWQLMFFGDFPIKQKSFQHSCSSAESPAKPKKPSTSTYQYSTTQKSATLHDTAKGKNLT